MIQREFFFHQKQKAEANSGEGTRQSTQRAFSKGGVFRTIEITSTQRGRAEIKKQKKYIEEDSIAKKKNSIFEA